MGGKDNNQTGGTSYENNQKGGTRRENNQKGGTSYEYQLTAVG